MRETGAWRTSSHIREQLHAPAAGRRAAPARGRARVSPTARGARGRRRPTPVPRRLPRGPDDTQSMARGPCGERTPVRRSARDRLRRLCRARRLAGPGRLRRRHPQRLARRVPDPHRRRARTGGRDGRRRSPGGLRGHPQRRRVGSREAVQWAEHAAGVGAPAVMCLPPTGYRADRRGVVEHFRAISVVGLPIVAYNNPMDTKVDLVPESPRGAVPRGAHRRGQGVHRRSAQGLRDPGTGARTRHPDRLSTTPSWSSRWPARRGGSPATPTPFPGRASSSTGPRPGVRPSAPCRCIGCCTP